MDYLALHTQALITGDLTEVQRIGLLLQQAQKLTQQPFEQPLKKSVQD